MLVVYKLAVFLHSCVIGIGIWLCIHKPKNATVSIIVTLKVGGDTVYDAKYTFGVCSFI